MDSAQDRFLVATGSKIWHAGDPGLPNLLRAQRLYKSLSLLLAHTAGVKIPPSLLLVDPRPGLVAAFARKWHYPVMIRMDYRTRPDAKPIGGIPLHDGGTVEHVCQYLIKSACVPLLQEHLDRFRDIFSVGALMTPDSDVADVEVVGKGFDAGDLRLGKVIPQETFRLNLTTGTCTDRKIIKPDTYHRERVARAMTIRRLKAYIEFANRSARLLRDLTELDPKAKLLRDAIGEIPPEYEEMPQELSRELAEIIGAIRSVALRGLPPSEAYVASLSFLRKEGWVPWDVYGDWYQR